MRYSLFTVMLMVAISVQAAPGDMNIGTFLAKADALKAKGIMALGSPDIGVLKAEVKGAGVAYRDRVKSDKAKGMVPHSCPPAKAAMKSDELLGHLRTYPAAQRQQVSIRTAFADLMKKRYPCQ
jgi:hypothetical protein